MGEDISRLMDGELEDMDVDRVCGQLKAPAGVADWQCYHLIGDTLRGTVGPAPGFSRRFSQRLAAEPTVLSPRAVPPRPATYAWAAAAGVAAVALVGWVAFGTMQVEPAALARAGQARTVRAPEVRPNVVPADYLVAHQEYSPTTEIQGAGLRSVAAPGPGGRP